MPYKDKQKQADYWREYQRRPKRVEYKKQWIKRNQERLTARQRERYRADPEKYRKYFRDNRIKKKYELSEVDYAALLLKQNGKCAICSKEPSGSWLGDRTLVIDHDHETGSIRGLLCNKCNRGLGILGDTEESLMRALDYLRKASSEPK